MYLVKKPDEIHLDTPCSHYDTSPVLKPTLAEDEQVKEEDISSQQSPSQSQARGGKEVKKSVRSLGDKVCS